MEKVKKIIESFESQLQLETDINLKFKIYNIYIYKLNQIDLDLALKKADEALELAKINHKDFFYHTLLYTKALCLTELENYEGALNLFVQVKDYFIKNNQIDYYAATLSNIGAILYYLKCYQQALLIWRDNLINFNSKNNIKYKFALINNLIMVYLKTYSSLDEIENQINEILNYYQSNQIDIDSNYCNALINLSNYHRIRFNEKKAIQIAEDCIALAIDESTLKLQFEAYLCLIFAYKQLKDDVNLLKYLKTTLIFTEKYKIEYRLEELFEELYQFYKRKNKFKEALVYLEKANYFNNKRTNSIIYFQSKIDNFVLKIDNSKDSKIVYNYIEKNTLPLNKDIFIEDKNGMLSKINIDNIVYVEAYNKMTKVIFSNTGSEVFKIAFKDFIVKVEQTLNQEHLLFYLNKRNLIVNLYWMSKFDKFSKMMHLNVFGNNYEFEISRNQMGPLKDFLSNK
jgi:tetratricopeptide (TPR) repeat protein